MIIGDDWFTKNMLVNTLSRTNNNLSQIGSTTTSIENSFTKVLVQLLMQVEMENSGQSDLNSSVPAFIDTSSNIINNQSSQSNFQTNLPSNFDEPFSFKQSFSPEINQYLDGKLAGMSETFVKAGKQFNIDPALLAAIAQHESANGKSLAARVKNNIAGMMGKNGLKSYSSIEESIMDMARNLSKNYLAKGLNTIAEIGAKYAPVGASNDPTGLNNHWVAGVTKFYDKLKA